MTIQCIQGTFDTLVIKVILGSFSAFPIFKNSISKTAGHRTKWIEKLASEVSIQCTQGTLTLKCLRSFWGIRCISNYRQPYISKTAGRGMWALGWVFSVQRVLLPLKCLRRKRLVVECGPWGWVFSVHRVLLPLKCLRSFWGHSVHFRFSKNLYLENGRS